MKRMGEDQVYGKENHVGDVARKLTVVDLPIGEMHWKDKTE